MAPIAPSSVGGKPALAPFSMLRHPLAMLRPRLAMPRHSHALPLLLGLGFSLAPIGALAAPGSATPAPTTSSLTTRLGSLELENGYPTKATAAKLYDELDLQRATQAYLWALPAVGFKALYDAQAQIGRAHV